MHVCKAFLIAAIFFAPWADASMRDCTFHFLGPRRLSQYLAENLPGLPKLQKYLNQEIHFTLRHPGYNRPRHFQFERLVEELKGQEPFRESVARVANFLATTHSWTANHLLNEVLADEERVQKEMDKASAREKSLYERNWAARQTGQIISTYPDEVIQMDLELERRPKRIIDIGSGHGVPCLLLALRNPAVECIGYDLVAAKVRGANQMAGRLGLSNVEFLEQDLSARSFELPEADVYYFFNPANQEIIDRMLEQVARVGSRRPVTVVSNPRTAYLLLRSIEKLGIPFERSGEQLNHFHIGGKL